jgi:hypothetical protein
VFNVSVIVLMGVLLILILNQKKESAPINVSSGQDDSKIKSEAFTPTIDTLSHPIISTTKSPTSSQKYQDQDTLEKYLSNPALKKMMGEAESLGVRAISDLINEAPILGDLGGFASSSVLSGAELAFAGDIHSPVTGYLMSAAAMVGSSIVFPVMILSEIIGGFFNDLKPSKAMIAFFDKIASVGEERFQYLKSLGLNNWDIFKLCTNYGFVVNQQFIYSGFGFKPEIKEWIYGETQEHLGIFTQDEWEICVANRLVGAGNEQAIGVDTTLYSIILTTIDPYQVEDCPYKKPSIYSENFGNLGYYIEDDIPVPVFNGQYAGGFIDSITAALCDSYIIKRQVPLTVYTKTLIEKKNPFSTYYTWPDLWKGWVRYNKVQSELAKKENELTENTMNLSIFSKLNERSVN